jgi:hypothetical protein
MRANHLCLYFSSFAYVLKHGLRQLELQGTQPAADYIDQMIVRWAMRKYKRLRGHKTGAFALLDLVKITRPTLFAHWCGSGSFAVGATGAR